MRRLWKLYLPAFSFVLAAVFALTPNSRAQADDDDHVTFTTIDFPGALGSLAVDISPTGDVVGRYCLEPSCIQDVAGPGWHGFLLSGGEFTTIDFPGAFHTNALGINARGDIVGRYRDVVGGPFHGFLLSGGEFTTIDFPEAFSSRAYGITPDGETIVGDYCSDPGCVGAGSGPWHGFLLSIARNEPGAFTFTSFDFPDAIFTQAWKINAAGQIVGRYKGTDGRFHVFVLSEGEFTTIDFPGAFNTGGDAGGINSRGDIVSSYCDTPACNLNTSGHGFLLRKGQFTSFDFPGADATTSAHGINARGDIVGFYGYKDAPTVPHAYLRSSGERDEDDNAHR